MKKLLSIIIACAMALLPASALAAPGDAFLLRSGENGFESSMRGMTLLDGQIYMLTYNGVYACAADGTKPVRYDLNVNSEQEDEDTYTSRDYHALLAWEGKLCVVVSETTNELYASGEDMETFATVEGVWLYELALEGESATLGEELAELDWFDFVIGGDYEYINSIANAFVQGDALFFTSYDESGNSFVARTSLVDGSTDIAYATELLTAEEGLGTICGYRDGSILATASRWNEDSAETKLYAVDIDQREAEEIFTFPTVGYALPFGMVYREDADALYYCCQGEVCVATGMDAQSVQSVAAVPVTSAEIAPLLTDDGLYVIADYQTVVRRNTDPTQRAQKRLTVQNQYTETIQDAYYDFTNMRGDVEVRMVDQVEDVVQAMMNRSSTVDVYCLDVASPGYDAVLNRGYMAELDASEKIAALLESCYPAVRDVCVREGVPVAIPVYAYANGSCGYSPEALEALGMTEDELPGTWTEFFESLPSFAGKVEGHSGVTLFESYMDRESVRTSLFYIMLAEYLDYISQPGREFAFDTPVFREIIAAFEAVDWEALGLADPEQMQEDAAASVAVIGGGEGAKALFYNYASVSAYGYAASRQERPLLLRLSEDDPPILRQNVQVAFVNPYSENREDAIAFLEAAVDAMEPLLAIHISPENNEPVRSRYYESNLAAIDEQIATLEKQLEEADGADRAAYEELLEQSREGREQYLRTGAWEASEESIAIYREYAQHIVVSRYTGLTGESATEFYTLQQQYLDGMISADELIEGIGGKLQMIMLEGM